MTTLKIQKNGNLATVHVQSMAIGGTITDTAGQITAVVTNGNDLKKFFARVVEKTGIIFFN